MDGTTLRNGHPAKGPRFGGVVLQTSPLGVIEYPG